MAKRRLALCGASLLLGSITARGKGEATGSRARCVRHEATHALHLCGGTGCAALAGNRRHDVCPHRASESLRTRARQAGEGPPDLSLSCRIGPMARTQNCSLCDELFEPCRPTQKYCSRKCFGISRRRRRQLCECGCGQEVKLLRSRYRPGHNPDKHNGTPIREGIWSVGMFKSCPRWRRSENRDGKRVTILRARVVMEGILGRELAPGEVVDHLDGDSLNDSPDNLVLRPSQSDHVRHHLARGDLDGFVSSPDSPRYAGRVAQDQG